MLMAVCLKQPFKDATGDKICSPDSVHLLGGKVPGCGELCSGDFHLVSTMPGSSSTSTQSNVKNV